MSAIEAGRWDLFNEEEQLVMALGLAYYAAHAPTVELQAQAARLMVEVAEKLGIADFPGYAEMIDQMRETLAKYDDER
jgi:hypothetical protein